MTAEEWEICREPETMIDLLLRRGVSDRKKRLFACACARQVWAILNPANRRLVHWQEEHAGEPYHPGRWRSAGWHEVFAGTSSCPLGKLPAPTGMDWEKGQRDRADRIRCPFANPFRPAPAIAAEWLAWQGGTVVRLARAAHDNRQMPSALLDNDLLRVLSDALEEAGCADPHLLGHLRSGGEHLRGCFLVDSLLGKE